MTGTVIKTIQSATFERNDVGAPAYSRSWRYGWTLTRAPLIGAFTLALGVLLTYAQGQSLRTYVSGTGNDSNACSETAPCLTLQGVLTKTAPGGQIYALSSANYGYVTIDKAVSIISGRGATGVLAASSVSGITINAGANDIINLQGLDIDGAGSGANGVLFSSGASLNIKDSTIRGFATGISFQPSAASALSVAGSLISNNTTGIAFQSGATSTGIFSDIQVVNNGSGVTALGASSSASAIVTLQGCMVANNPGVGIQAGTYSAVTVSNCTVANNGVGLQAQSASALLQASGSTITGNATGWQVSNSGQVISASNNSISGNTTGNAAPPASPDPPPPPAPTYVAKNIVTDFGARCDGVADDAPAFMSFNSWARTQSLPIKLTIPSGATCNLASTPSTFAVGVRNLIVSGYGASMYAGWLGGFGIIESTTNNSRVATVAAGATSAMLLKPSQSSLFKVGDWAVLAGLDIQGYGYPPNQAFFEYVQITATNAATGEITFSNPIANSYKSTWPHYLPTTNPDDDTAGAATLFALNSSWDTILRYEGMTFNLGSHQAYANGRSVTFTDVTFNCSGSAGLAPTQNLNITLNNVTQKCQMEVDKLVTNLSINGGSFDQLFFQSSSGATVFTMDNATVMTLNGTPQKSVISNSNIGTFVAGSVFLGRTTEISCNTCNIASFKNPPGGVLDNNVDRNYTMGGGVITVPNSNGPVRWAVPGANAMFALYNGSLLTQGVPFQVIDVTQDANNTYVHTSLGGVFPALPTDPTNGLSIYGHPAPKFTCTGCTGSADAIDFSGAPAGIPLFSYSQRTYNGSVPNPPAFTMWGSVIKISINVTKAYTGVRSTLTLDPIGNVQVISNGSATGYSAGTVNLKVAGQRDIFPGSVTGLETGDSLTAPANIWLQNIMAPHVSADISGEPSSVWPSFTIQVTTDQGVVNQ